MSTQPYYFLLPAVFLFLSITHAVAANKSTSEKNHIVTLFHVLNGVLLMWLAIVFIIKPFQK